jgi:hypothetical protein
MPLTRSITDPAILLLRSWLTTDLIAYLRSIEESHHADTRGNRAIPEEPRSAPIVEMARPNAILRMLRLAALC